MRGGKRRGSHFGAVPAFAEGGIHDSVGVGVGPTWVGDPGADSRFRVEDAMHRVPTRISKAGTTAWSQTVPGLISEPLMPVLACSLQLLLFSLPL